MTSHTMPAVGSWSQASLKQSAQVMQVLEDYLAQLERGAPPHPEELLAQHPELAEPLKEYLASLEFLHKAALNLHSGDRPQQAAPAAEPPDLGQLGDYRILREIGRGGMGVVYEAEQVSLRRQVALKVLPFAAALDAKQLQRFKNEAQAAAHLHHTNIVPVFGVGCERGVHYYAMQFIEGQTLASLVQELRQLAGREDRGWTMEDRGSKGEEGGTIQDRGPRNETKPGNPLSSILHPLSSHSFFRTVANLGVQAAEALEYAHQEGIVHRDIKPANLLVDAGGRLWITDFGLAHCQSQAGLTMTGDLVGTLRYMSPEQALAKRALVDARTDVYSLGVTLYELLTLERAFAGADREELLRQIAFEEPRPPRQHNKTIPRELETIILKAVEKSPEARYATAQELADDLRRFVQDEPIRARRPTLLQRAAKWSRRHKPLLGAAAVVCVLAALTAAGNGLWFAQKRAETAGAVQEALQRAGALQAQSKWPEALEAAERAQALLQLGGGSTDLRQRVGGLVTNLKMIRCLEDIRLGETAFKDGLLDDLRADSLYAEAFRNYGIDVDALEAAEAAERIRARPIHVELAAALDHWGHVRLMEQAGDSLNCLPRPGGKVAQTGDKANWQHLLAVARRADPDPWRNRFRDVVGPSLVDRKILKELAAAAEIASLPPPTLYLLGYYLADVGAVDTAVTVLRQAQQQHADDFWINNDLGLYLQRLGQPVEAIPFHTAALALRPHRAFAHYMLGRALLDKGALEQAIAASHEAIRLGPDDAPGAYTLLGDALLDKGALDEAVAAYHQAIAMLKKLQAREPRSSRARAFFPQALGGQAAALIKLGRLKEADQSFKELEQIYRESLELDPSDHLDWFWDAPLRLQLGDVEGYRQVCREMLVRFGQTDDPHIAERTAKTCLLVPDGLRDLGPVLQLADRAVTGTEQLPDSGRFLLVRGMADYRAGHFADAIERLTKTLSLVDEPRNANSRCLAGTAQSFLAMAHHRLGQASQARRALGQATELMKQKKHPGLNWDHWLRFDIVRHEAEQVVKGNGEPPE